MLDFALKTAGNLLSPPGKRARLSILIYHRVLRRTDPLFPFEVDAGRFEAQMKTVRDLFHILPLSEAVFRLKNGTLPARSACVTFDDGYADNAEVALPILQRCHIPATFFVADGFLDGGIMFNDRIIEIIRQCNEPQLDLTPLGLDRLPLSSLEQKRSAIAALQARLKYTS
ncbi:MAG TPA: polysaccharide deacetylase family protein, partial [Burkholderiales bacterium]|nr:polysaccharide deacetylase family protein [Burkholderiales bacterium]